MNIKLPRPALFVCLSTYLLNLLDAFNTVYIIRVLKIGMEKNPLLAWLFNYGYWGDLGFFCIKILFGILFTLIVFKWDNKSIKVASVFCLLMYLALVIYQFIGIYRFI